MRFRHELDYAAPPAEVFAMLTDPAFREAVGVAQDVVSAEVTVEGTGDGCTVVVDQVQRTEGLPSFARTFAGDTTRAVQREVWTDGSRATVVIDSPGKPAEVSGTVTLRAEGSGTREVVELDLKVKVPLLGGKLEKLLAERITAALETEHEVGRAHLGRS